MREVSKEEMREVAAGKWKCHMCGQKFSLWIKLWSSAAHNCVGFKYHWVFFQGSIKYLIQNIKKIYKIWELYDKCVFRKSYNRLIKRKTEAKNF